jgi:hypothetical protein
MKNLTQNNLINRIPLLPAPSGRRSLALAAITVFGISSAAGMSTNVQWRVEAAVKETYDSNVYIQDLAPTNNVPGAVEAKKDSFVTTVSPRLFADYTPCLEFKAALSYTPDFTWYHSAASEDNMTHRFGVNFGGTVEKAVWELQNSFVYIDGSEEGPIFGRPGDVPAIGGIPLRDRREAFVYRSSFRVTEMFGKWMIRPVASAYIHDFKTELRPTPAGANYVYENYIDRQDINGGLDAGYQAAKNLRVVLGYRYGRQDQFKGPFGAGGSISDSPYDNSYHRILVGLEGTPLPWLRLGIMAGPDIRQFDNEIQGFDSNELLYYVDASLSILPTKKDVITLSNKRYEQPAFSSFSMYEDVTYDLTWKHLFNDHWATSAGFRLYIGDWQAPVNREDWIYTPSVGLAYAYNKHLSAELTYSYDWVENQVPTTAAGARYAEGREYTRHLVSLALKCAF